MTQANKEVFQSLGKWILLVVLPVVGLNILCQLLGYDGLIGNAIWEFAFIFVPVVWIVLAVLFGIMEAYLWAYKVKTGDIYNYDEHKILTATRLLIMFLCARLLGNIWQPILLWGMFSFFHDGSYYLRRKKLSIQNGETNVLYKKGWFDQSTTSTALWTIIMTPVNRTILFSICLVGYIWYQSLFWK